MASRAASVIGIGGGGDIAQPRQPVDHALDRRRNHCRCPAQVIL